MERLLRFIYLATTIGVVLFAASCEEKIAYTRTTDQPIAGDQEAVTNTIDLSDTVVSKLTVDALAGDNDAALTLSIHYEAVGDLQSSRKWLELAAERESCAGISRLIFEMELERADEKETSEWRKKYAALKCKPKKQYQYRE